jgi:hypothetical protein
MFPEQDTIKEGEKLFHFSGESFSDQLKVGGTSKVLFTLPSSDSNSEAVRKIAETYGGKNSRVFTSKGDLSKLKIKDLSKEGMDDEI